MVTVRQQVPLGLGHAIWCARAFIGDDPFAILLPDDLVLADTPCLRQLADAYRETGGNVVAVTEVPREQTNRYGILKIGKDDGRLVEVLGLVEKPAPEGRAVQPVDHRPLCADAGGDRPSRAHGARRRRRGAADRRHGQADRHPAVPWPALRGHGASTAATRSASWRRRSPSP